jgi:hypothetical protein
VDAAGRFALPGGPERGFVLEAESPGYVPLLYDRYKERARDADDVVELRMQRAEPLLGMVRVADGEAPAVGARVEAHAPQGGFATAVTDAQGGFALETVDWDGQAPLYVHARDDQGRSARRRVGKRGEAVELLLVPPLELAVEVVQGGAPVVGALVALRSDGALTTVARTQGDGGAALVHELAGPESVQAVAEARFGTLQSVPVVLDLAEPRDGPLRIELDAGDWLEGWVSDSFGVPVGSAKLALQADPRAGSPLRLAGHADVEGRFKLGPLTPDVTWRLGVSAEGHRYAALGSLHAGPDPVYVTLEPVVSWTGRALDAVTRQPARAFTGQLMQEVFDAGRGEPVLKNTRERMSMTPGVPGAFSVPLPGPGRYSIRIVAKDYIPAESLRMDTNGITPPPPVELLLWPAALLDVTVQDGRGRPVQGYEVTLVPWELAQDAQGPSAKARKAGSRTRTGSDGVGHFNLDKGGAYRVAGGPGAWFDEARVQVAPGLTTQRLYRLPATGDVELTIVDEQAQLLGGVMVELRSSRDEQAHSIYRRTGMRGAAGVVVIETVPPGTYTVRLRRRNYSSSTHEIYVRGNAIERVRLVMEPRPPPSGQTDGVVISGARSR